MLSLLPRAVVVLARLLVPCLILCSARLAWGQVTTAPSSSVLPEAPREAAIVLMFDPHEDDSLALVGSIAAHLAGLPLRLIHEPRPRSELLTWLEAGRRRVKETRALGLFAVDVSRRDGWRLFFLEAEGIPTLIRRLKPTPEHAPLDEAGITVSLLVEALLDGKHVEVTEPVLRDEPAEAGEPLPTREPASAKPRPATGPASTPRPKRAVSDRVTPSEKREEREEREDGEETSGELAPIETGPAPVPGRIHPIVLLGLTTTHWLSQQGFQSGVLTGLGLSLDRTWSLSLDYTWYSKFGFNAPGATLSVTRHPVAGRVSYRLSPGFSPVFCMGAWLDAISRETNQANAGYRSTASTTALSWGITSSVGLASPRLSVLSVRLELGVDVAARRVGYAVQSEAAEPTLETVLESSSVRPLLGLILDLEL